jgi:hypothetical protein
LLSGLRAKAYNAKRCFVLQGMARPFPSIQKRFEHCPLFQISLIEQNLQEFDHTWVAYE